MKEEKIEFQTSKDVFYNPAMRLCRSISSLAVGAIGEKIDVIDSFCASGIRGIRYVKENKNVKHVTFIDIEQKAINLAKKNASANKLTKTKFEAIRGNVSRLAFENAADFLEIDPFGTPAPYLVDAFRYFNPKKSAFLSVTATDVAVLCGGITAACMKNYHSKPLNNEFTHENGLRILIKRIAEVAAEFNMGITPLISFSNRHYLKTILHVKRGADGAYDSLKKLGYVSFCRQCGFRSHSQFPQERCTRCKAKMNYAGPLWFGELHEKEFLKKMAGLNKNRDYSDREEIGKMLSLMEGEIGMPPYYYDVHALAKLKKATDVPKLEYIIAALKSRGYRAVRTHFSPIAIKTGATSDAVVQVMGWKD